MPATSAPIGASGTSADTSDDRTPSRKSVALWTLGVFAAAFVAALLIYHQMWGDPTHRTLGGGGHHNDPLQSMWFLKAVPWQLFHGHDPLRSNAIGYPYGVNLAWNTSTPTLALLMTPVTMLAGATFSYALLMTLAPAATAATAFLWLRRHVTYLPAAVVGALLIGYSPFATGHLKGHLHLAFAALVPLMLILLEDILWRHPRPARRSAIYLGVVTAAQLGISEELVVTIAIGVVIAMLSYLLVDARALVGAVRTAARPVGLAALIVVVLASPLLIEQLFVGDFIHMHNSRWRATISDYLLPSGNTILRGFGRANLNVGGAEDGVYVGPVLLAVLVCGVLLSVRDRLVRCAVITVGVLVVLSFGDIRVLGIAFPWHYLQRLPGLSAALPVRLSFASWFVIAWLIARWIDRLHATASAGSRYRRVAAVAGIAAVAGALVTLVPKAVGASTLVPVPQVLVHPPAGVPRGSPVLLLPPATPNDSLAMYFQQAADFSFVMPSGYAYRNGAKDSTLWAPQTPLERLSERPNRARPTDLPNARADLVRLHYREIVVVKGLPGSTQSREVATRLAGRPPDRIDSQTWVWLLPG